MMEIGHRCQTILHVLPLVLFARPSGRVAPSPSSCSSCVFIIAGKALINHATSHAAAASEIRGQRRGWGIWSVTQIMAGRTLSTHVSCGRGRRRIAGGKEASEWKKMPENCIDL